MSPEDKNLPQSIQALLLQADNCTSAGRYEQAKKCYDKVLSLKPSCKDAWIGMGVLALQQDQFRSAQGAFRQAIKSDPYCWRAWMGIALLYNLKGDKKNALQALERAKNPYLS